MTSQVTGSDSADSAGKPKSGGDYDFSVTGEAKKIGQSILGQITGSEDLAQKAAADKEFSEREHAVIAAKIKQMYQEHATKAVRKEKQQEMEEEQQEAQKEQVKEVKKE